MNSPNLKGVFRLRRCLRNWFQVASFLNRGDRGETIDLHFRNGIDVRGNSYWRVMAFVYYYDLSRRWKAYADEDFHALVSVADDISTKLSSKFRREEMEYIGGVFNFKSAVLFLMVRKLKPLAVIETGVAQGVSSYGILKALDLNGSGRLISIDLPTRNPEGTVNRDGTRDPVHTPSSVDPGWLVPEELRRLWDLRLGRSEELLLQIEEPIDMFFHDSDHSYANMKFEFDWAYRHLRKGGLLVSDDTWRNSAFERVCGTTPRHEAFLAGISQPAEDRLIRNLGSRVSARIAECLRPKRRVSVPQEMSIWSTRLSWDLPSTRSGPCAA